MMPLMMSEAFDIILSSGLWQLAIRKVATSKIIDRRIV